MIHWLHPDAEKELGDAAVYYLHNAGHTVAEAFLAEYERVCDLIINNQKLAMQHVNGLRSFPFEHFSFTVIYEENLELGPLVFAIAHQKREPGYWQSRIQEPEPMLKA